MRFIVMMGSVRRLSGGVRFMGFCIDVQFVGTSMGRCP